MSHYSRNTVAITRSMESSKTSSAAKSFAYFAEGEYVDRKTQRCARMAESSRRRLVRESREH